MLNLAIECSGVAGSVGLYEERECRGERILSPDFGSVQTLASAIDDLLRQNRPSGLRRADLISVLCGPGSFTGLRVGVATAQMLAFAWRIPVVPVDTLAAIAYRVAEAHQLGIAPAAGGSSVLIPVLNAFRKQVFVAAWVVNDRLAASRAGIPELELPNPGCRGLKQIAASQVLASAAWQADPWGALVTLQPDLSLPAPVQVVVAGPGLRTYVPSENTNAVLAAPDFWEPTAAAVAQLGWQLYQRGGGLSAERLRPNYIRASAAEEQLG